MFVGDIHGNLDLMYSRCRDWEKSNQIKLDLIIQVGDFEAIRWPGKEFNISGPRKYRKPGDFPEYFTGNKMALYPTFFIGGNHEDYDFLDQYKNGQQVAHNIFYLGRSGMIKIGSSNVAYLSGIYNYDHFESQHPELNMNGYSKTQRTRAIYFNKEDIEKLDLNPDILITHDIPTFEVKRESPNYLDYLVETLNPAHHICGHLHYLRYVRTKNETQIRVLSHIGRSGDLLFLEL